MTPGPNQPPITEILGAAARGDREAASRLLPVVYDELRRLARARLDRTPPGNTLQPTALVHEAYLKLVGSGDPGWDGRNHFFAAAARAMRDIVVDHARAKSAQKRGGGAKRVDLDAVDVCLERSPEEIVALDAALAKLEVLDARKAHLVTLRCFGGLTQGEAAAAMDLSERTIEREWRFTKAWLRRELAAEVEGGSGAPGAAEDARD